MLAAVLTLLWRQIPSVQELTRLLAREDLLWCRATKIAQQSLAQRFLVFPAELFENVFKDLLPQLQQNWQQRLRRGGLYQIVLSLHGRILNTFGWRMEQPWRLYFVNLKA